MKTPLEHEVETPADVVRAQAATRQALVTAAGDAGAEQPERERPSPQSDSARKLKQALGIGARA